MKAYALLEAVCNDFMARHARLILHGSGDTVTGSAGLKFFFGRMLSTQWTWENGGCPPTGHQSPQVVGKCVESMLINGNAQSSQKDCAHETDPFP